MPLFQGSAGLPQYQGEFDIFEAPDISGAVDGGGTTIPPGYVLRPSIITGFTANSNARTQNGEPQPDFIPFITPSIFATANTPYVVGSANYAPTFRYSTSDPSSSRVYQIFNANGRLTLIPERVFMNVLGFGSIIDTYGGFAPSLTSAAGLSQNSSNINQTLGLQLAPTVVHRFGTAATGQIGYTYRYVQSTGTSAYLQGSNTPFFRSNETSANTAYAILRTGEDFGRFALQAYGVGTAIEGTGAAAGSRLFRTSLEGRYSILPEFAVSSEIGYDDQRYEGTNPFTIEKPLWSVGIRAVPTPDSFILLRYGQRNGYRSPYLRASVPVGSRTRITATYTDQIGITSLATLDLLSSTGIDELGNPYDTRATVPILPVPLINSFFSTQSSVQRFKNGFLSAIQSWDRDSLIFSAFYRDSIPLTSQPGTTPFYQKGYGLSLGWTHQLTPTLNSGVFGSYGQTESTPQSGTTTVSAPNRYNNYSARFTLTERFSETLFGTLSYIYIYRGGSVVQQQSTQNIVLATLRKTF